MTSKTNDTVGDWYGAPHCCICGAAVLLDVLHARGDTTARAAVGCGFADAHADHERRSVRAAIGRARNLAEGILRHIRSFRQLNLWTHGLLARRTVARW
jgi:hypothetical protein